MENIIDIMNDLPTKEYQKSLDSVPGLKELINQYHSSADANTKYFLMEFALHGLAEYSLLSKNKIRMGHFI